MAWRLAKSLEILRGQINAAHPNRSKVSDGTVGDTAHSTRKSDHNPNAAGVVCAFDVTHDLDRKGDDFDAWKFAETLRLNRDSRIGYVISNGRIFSGPAGPQPFVWRTYTGSNKHAQHTHVSVRQVAALYDDAAPWALSSATAAAAPAPAIAPPAGITATLRHAMAKTIIDYEAARDAAGHLKVHVPVDGSFEVAGLNSASHPAAAAELRRLVESGQHAASEKYVADFILQYTKSASGWTTDAGVEFMLRDCVYNRGSKGGAMILQYAIGFEGDDVDGEIGQLSRARLTAEAPLTLLPKLRAARERYEREVMNRNESDRRWRGLVNRWDKSLIDAKKFYEQGRSPAGGAATRSTVVIGELATTAGTAATAAQKPEGGIDWLLLIPILVVGASIALVTWFVWPRKEKETAL